MKKILVFLILILAIGCGKENKTEIDLVKVPKSITGKHTYLIKVKDNDENTVEYPVFEGYRGIIVSKKEEMRKDLKITGDKDGIIKYESEVSVLDNDMSKALERFTFIYGRIKGKELITGKNELKKIIVEYDENKKIKDSFSEYEMLTIKRDKFYSETFLNEVKKEEKDIYNNFIDLLVGAGMKEKTFDFEMEYGKAEFMEIEGKKYFKVEIKKNIEEELLKKDVEFIKWLVYEKILKNLLKELPFIEKNDSIYGNILIFDINEKLKVQYKVEKELYDKFIKNEIEEKEFIEKIDL